MLNGRIQAALYYARKKRRARIAGTPALLDAPVISGTPTVGQTLTCSTGDWSNSPISYQYIWRRDGTIIEGASSEDYLLVEDDAGAEINCTVRAGNRNGSGGATSESVGPVAEA